MNDLKVLNDLIILLARLTAARAGYLDELAAANLPTDIAALLAAGIAVAGSVADVGAAVTDFDTNLTEATDNHYNGMLLLSTSGVTAGQAHQIDVYTGGAKNVAFAASDQWTEAPANGSTFVIIPNPGAYLKKIFTAMATTIAGRTQPFTQNITSAANAAGDVVLATATNQAMKIKAVVLRSNGATTADLVSIAIFCSTGKVNTLIDAVKGIRANIAAQGQQVSEQVEITLMVGETIVANFVGTGATAVNLQLDIEGYAITDGGYLA